MACTISASNTRISFWNVKKRLEKRREGVLEVFLANEQEKIELIEARWERRLLDLMQYEALPENTQLSITFVDDRRIRELNAAYRQIDQPTDVLAFTQTSPPVLPPDAPLAIGDIVVSVETALRQAKEYGHAFERELGFLLVHGFLHLLGEDHQTAEQERRMIARQRALLALWDFGL
ncbi:MAG: rRNA maturation RNase YbeY [Cyanobacteria bacterium NC_groundwater_1444_Ag_S-0.65um_54_12]|nr:rRNA maturation RNase YbeY [Cyanobacteria bacterium NC_groundwater_1444_Ag_S-0.65um_54_12]